MQKILAALLCVSTLSIQAGTGLEAWLDYNVMQDLGERAQLRILQQYQFEHGFDSLFSVSSQQLVLFQPVHWMFLGPYVTLAQCKIDGTWRKEAQPGIMVRNWFRAAGFDWFTRLQVFHRVREAQPNATGASFALGIDLYSSKKFTAYLANEAYWNFCATHQLDQNYTFFGVNGDFNKWFNYDVYYNVYPFKAVDTPHG